MNSKVDELVEAVKTYIEIIIGAGRMNSLWTQEGLAPFMEKFSELADEVSILETERQRLAEENRELQFAGASAWKEIAKLVEENRNLQKQVQDLKTWNNNQAKALIKSEKRYFTDGHYDYAHTYQDMKTGMKYVKINHKPYDDGELDFDDTNGTDYALNA